MDQMVQQMSEGNNNTAPYGVPEIWQFPVNHNANAASFSSLAANMSMSMHMGMSMNVDINNGDAGMDDMMNREHDPMVLDHRASNGSVNLRKRREEDGKGGASTSSNGGNAMNENDNKRLKRLGANENQESKQEGEGNSSKAAEQTSKPQEPPKQDYIHVRARRGQATDSHSLAERARREKISERMKILQDLVPGCNKVIGKALVLDEIINYIQSLQRQVEFLSMKLEAVNTRVPPVIEGFPSKEYGQQQQAFDTSALAFGSQAARDYRGTSPEWLHMQLGGGFDRTS